ncbi:dehydrogenase [Pistricoccus aurantiacus]|uniref:Dehydrogenase n=2 Tax=Pistricoccus aurantiacus TaxID=1883414 RepID=A0A5B8SXW8_9GAMM|nr:dehydrogenase [Pistricoccus aurantiacus]
MGLTIEAREDRESRSEDEGRALYDEMVRFGEDLTARGKLLASRSLRPDKYGVRIHQRGTRLTLLDGPFPESKEMVGGFFLIDCADREEAIAIAGQFLAARFATVEVRECAPCYVG